MEEKEPLISVIVPVYKVEAFIHRCIESILSQTFRDFELILVDDGSPDNSGSICDEYAEKDSRVRVIHKLNGGVSSARNAGIEIAKGKWICFVDSDDYVGSTYLKDFDLCGNEDCLYIQGFTEEYPDYNVPHLLCDICNDADLFIKAELNNILNSPCYKLYKSEVLKNGLVTFPEKTAYGEDHVFTMRYLQSVSLIRYTNKCSYTYYKGDRESLTSHKIPIPFLKYYLETILPLLMNECEKRNVDVHYTNVIYNNRYYDTCMRMIKSSQNKTELANVRGCMKKYYNKSFDGLLFRQKLYLLFFSYMPLIFQKIILNYVNK